jgi:hypothetical protein
MEGNGRDREILLSILYYRYQTFKDISSKKPMRGSIHAFRICQEAGNSLNFTDRFSNVFKAALT